MSKKSNIEYLSAKAVSRLSYEEKQEYFRNMLATGSNSDESRSELEVYPEEELIDEKYLRADANLDSEAENIGESYSIELKSESESDSDETDKEEAALNTNNNYFTSKYGTKWYKHTNTFFRQRAHNIIHDSSRMGPTSITKNLSPVDTFFCIMSSPIRDQICRFSNKKAEDVFNHWNANNPDKHPLTWTKITDIEFTAFLGILLVMGTQKSSKEKLSELWKQNAFPLYRATMSINRFQQILRFIRFYNHMTRVARQSADKAAPVRDMFEMINSNLKIHFQPYECITVDEQLYGYRGRTKFTQYIPSKPAKYGIKIWWACDSKTSYPLNGQIYIGKEGSCRDVNQGERFVKDLIVPYKNFGRNVTVDNFFTSLSLLEELIKWKMTIVGTLKKNKRYIPEEFKASKNRELFSSEFGFGPNATMTSYVPARGKAVVLLSSMHRHSVITGTKKKPEIIQYYNKTEGGVDTMDKMLSQYSTKRPTRRWPLAMFFNLLDISALAAYIIYDQNNTQSTVKKSGHRLFLNSLGTNLCIPQIKSRAENQMVVSKFFIKTAMECILGEPLLARSSDDEFEPNVEQQRDATGRIKQKGGCYICYHDSKRKRASRKECIKCKKPICAAHCLTQTKCQNCYKNSSSQKYNLREKLAN